MSDDTNETDNVGEAGKLLAFRGIIRDLIILVPLLITLCASIGGLFQGCTNGKGIEQHSQQLGEIKGEIQDKATSLEKTAKTVEKIDAKTTGKEP